MIARFLFFSLFSIYVIGYHKRCLGRKGLLLQLMYFNHRPSKREVRDLEAGPEADAMEHYLLIVQPAFLYNPGESQSFSWAGPFHIYH